MTCSRPAVYLQTRQTRRPRLAGYTSISSRVSHQSAIVEIILVHTIPVGELTTLGRSEVIMDEEPQKASGLALDFLSGGGEMGRHLRAHDWSTTRLGRPERWPLSLQTAIKLLLAARSPILLRGGQICSRWAQ